MKRITIPEQKIFEISENEGTPFHIYDESVIVRKINSLKKSFKWVDYKQYFAIKANPNPNILKIMKENDCGVDAASVNEIQLALDSGFNGEDIMFTSNLTTLKEYKYAIEKNCVINIDWYEDIYLLSKNNIIPDKLCFRLNPGGIKNDIIGDSRESKFGSTKEQIEKAVEFVSKKGKKNIGLHTMVVSNEKDPKIFSAYTKEIFEFAKNLQNKFKIIIDFINIGGGIGIPYKPEQKVDISNIAKSIEANYKNIFNDKKPKIFTESGRYITAQSGYLITKVIKKKLTFKNYLGVDAAMSDLMRPGMYGSYHHITNLSFQSNEKEEYDVVGSLCENNDKFAINRKLPLTTEGDILAIHDTGAHAHSMGFNYNGKLRHAEYLYTKDKKIRKIRRDETYNDYTKTILGGF
ncbi:MAG: diaminopimelate decarboxylase [Thermotogota bacterium]